MPEWRKRKGRHSLASVLKQRVFQIASGYEDQNDADALRRDPLLKMVCGSLPEGGPDLASQPTICRLENAASMRSCYQIAEILFEHYLSQREKDGAPRRVLLLTSTPLRRGPLRSGELGAGAQGRLQGRSDGAGNEQAFRRHNQGLCPRRALRILRQARRSA